jgi:hypothetical protein
MESGLPQAGAGAPHINCVPASTRLSRRVCAVVAVAVAVCGCTPIYYDTDLVMSDAATPSPRSASRAKQRVPLPSASLLRPLAPPDCGEAPAADPQPAAKDPNRTASAAVVEQASTARPQPRPDAERTDHDGELALRIKLEYERECYRQAEARARERLLQLQSSIGETVKSVHRVEQQSH